ncbi:antitoxin [Sulfuriferula sp. AH1]|uniref:type II toxin-antitoxin system prevent-host-death family antitoxin n=1 Tax=Sulfuriferula sp. AH1 TaxID=1985873 RepID=UPI000B3B77F6|nr:type II toxin-antitoxin system prevent-host-death family antitoxin [Sulfuriferula sp. AH1]ARU30944.1 antitoxin [Sulfuriferula sp. AH1]
MQTIFTDLTISMSDFKKNPAKVLREAGQKPVAVLNHNKPAFYMVDPQMFELLIEQLADNQLMPLLQARMAQRANAVEVNIDEI